MKKEIIEVPDGYELKQTENGKWELVKGNIKDILKDNGFFTSTYFYLYKGLGYGQKNKRVNRIIALAKLQCVADYLNDGWEPDWNNEEDKWHIEWYNNQLVADWNYDLTCGEVIFKTEELAKKAIKICGEQLIKEALMVK